MFKQYKFPDNELDKVSNLELTKIEIAIAKINPEIVLTHSNKDLNIDHKIVSNATVTACRPFPKSSIKNSYFLKFHLRQSGILIQKI